MPANQPTELEVRALGFLPLQRTVTPGQDTTLVLTLRPDPLARRMIAHQVARLEARTKSIPFSTIAMNRQELIERHYNWTVTDVIDQP